MFYPLQLNINENKIIRSFDPTLAARVLNISQIHEDLILLYINHFCQWLHFRRENITPRAMLAAQGSSELKNQLGDSLFRRKNYIDDKKSYLKVYLVL